MKIGLLGASFDTGNMGVSALAESAIKCILHQWPDAEITLLDSGRVVNEEQLRIADKDIRIRKRPIRFCRNIFLDNHFVVLCLYGILLKLFRSEKFRRFCARRNSALNSMTQIDLVADITGGDSFSDIYGMRRFTIGFLRKWLLLLFGKKLILLPQTYGPFKRRTAKFMARYILKRATAVYSRDRESLEYAKALLGNPSENGKVGLAPDVAFALDSRRPNHGDIDSLERIKSSNRILVGLNVSGLLACCGAASNNVFNLKIDYPALTDSIVTFLMKQDGVAILLVPHVVSLSKSDDSSPKRVHKKGYREQSDSVACGRLYERFAEKYPGRIFMVGGHYNHNETKYIIGLCDFFIGSRMHSCIAALSQCIPAVGVAYSGKFQGVFESVGVADCVADARNLDNSGILDQIEAAFDRREQTLKHLKDVMPGIKADILDLFNVPAN